MPLDFLTNFLLLLYLYCYNLLLFLFLDNAFCSLFLPFNVIVGSHSAMSQDGLPAKALFLSDLLKKIYLHILVHSPRLGSYSIWELLARAVVPVLCEQLCRT